MKLATNPVLLRRAERRLVSIRFPRGFEVRGATCPAMLSSAPAVAHSRISRELLLLHQPSQAANLAKVMAPMQVMKSSPLVRRQRTKEGVIYEFHVTPKVLFAGLNAFLHSCNISCYLEYRFFRCHPLGTHPGGGLPTTWQVTKARDYESSQAILRRGPAGRRFSSLPATLEDHSGPAVGERKVLQDLCYAPLTFRVPAQLLGREAGGLQFNKARQSPERSIHAQSSPSSRLE